MRRIALFTACGIASGILLAFQAPAGAGALPPTGINSGVAQDGSVQLAQRRGGGARAFRGGSVRAFRGGSVRAFRGGGARAFRGGSVRAFRGGSARAWRGRGGRAWRGGARRVWRGGRWVWVGVPAVAAAPYYYGNCPLVRRTVWTRYGYRVRWVRRCY